MKRLLLLFVGISSVGALAGSFEEYNWRLGFLVAQGHYQATIKISYRYDSEDQFEPSVLALPHDDNLKLRKLVFKVDGQKVEPLDSREVTWWSHGKPIHSYIPSQEGTKVEAEAFYLIKNLFLMPPAPTNLPVYTKRLNVGFAPLEGFELTGSFIGTEYQFKSRRVSHRVGEPSHVYGIWRRNVKPATQQELLFLIPKSFTFSFNNLRGAQWDAHSRDGIPYSGATLGNLDTQAGHSGFSLTGDLKPYSANFYKGNPIRDWQYALTWLQQERTYLPFGIQPGRRVQSRALFYGAGNKTDDLIPWVDPLDLAAGDAAPENNDFMLSEEPGVNETTNFLENLELFLENFRETHVTDRNLSRLIAYHTKQGSVSPAQLNRDLANELNKRFGLKCVPALISIYPEDRIAALPLSAFDAVITGIKLGKNWFFVDAADPNWTFSRANHFLKGHSVVILAENNAQMGSF